jgi:peptidoglycan/LPS O-acetylase OafA/YrhL
LGRRLLSLFLSRPTLEARLAATGDRSSGFDYMRVTLALLIIGLHSGEISYGPVPPENIYSSLWRAPVATFVPMFFALSGFLVAGSLERSRSLFTFIGLRALRIVPALAGEVFLSALVLGPLLTTYPLAAYFSDPRFFVYFRNIIGDIHYQLPGLFVGNPDTDAVNAQLWTVPYELVFYILCSAIALLGIYKRRVLMLVSVGFFFLAVLYKVDLEHHARPWTVEGRTLLMTAAAGMLFHRFKKFVPWNFGLFLTAALLSILLFSRREWDAFSPLPLTYATIYLGLLDPPRHKYILSGDYSYGLYLYGFPVQQAVASFGPAFRHWYINLLLAVPGTALCAFISWWLIERPALGLRRRLRLYREKSSP